MSKILIFKYMLINPHLPKNCKARHTNPHLHGLTATWLLFIVASGKAH